MINDNQTNMVYFSAILKENPFTAFCNNLVSILQKHGILFRFLENTADIWCRDYMPVQVREDKFIEYVYDPDYLKGRRSHLRSDASVVCRSAGIKTIKTDIVLDGSNIIKYNQCPKTRLQHKLGLLKLPTDERSAANTNLRH